MGYLVRYVIFISFESVCFKIHILQKIVGCSRHEILVRQM